MFQAHQPTIVGCAACNLHTAIALVSRMKAMGIEASCKQLVMQPCKALERRKQQHSRQQVHVLTASCPVVYELLGGASNISDFLTCLGQQALVEIFLSSTCFTQVFVLCDH